MTDDVFTILHQSQGPSFKHAWRQ